jgi:hypothetical protein
MFKYYFRLKLKCLRSKLIPLRSKLKIDRKMKKNQKNENLEARHARVVHVPAIGPAQHLSYSKTVLRFFFMFDPTRDDISKRPSRMCENLITINSLGLPLSQSELIFLPPSYYYNLKTQPRVRSSL